MSEQDYNADIDSTTTDETEETTVEESQETLESESHDEYAEELTPAAKAFKEKRREENRRNREAAAKLDKVEAELEFNKFLRKSPDAEDYEQDINDFRAKNPTIGLEQAYRYVLADKNPAKLAELADSGNYAQANQGRTAPATGDKSFSEQINQTPNLNDMDALKREAEKAYANIIVG